MLAIENISTPQMGLVTKSSPVEGFNKSYDVILVEDATASSCPELHKTTLMKVRGFFGLVLTTEQLIDMMHITKRRASAFRLSTESL